VDHLQCPVLHISLLSRHSNAMLNYCNTIGKISVVIKTAIKGSATTILGSTCVNRIPSLPVLHSRVDLPQGQALDIIVLSRLSNCNTRIDKVSCVFKMAIKGCYNDAW
jgi:hypothetical protein